MDSCLLPPHWTRLARCTHDLNTLENLLLATGYVECDRIDVYLFERGRLRQLWLSDDGEMILPRGSTIYVRTLQPHEHFSEHSTFGDEIRVSRDGEVVSAEFCEFEEDDVSTDSSHPSTPAVDAHFKFGNAFAHSHAFTPTTFASKQVLPPTPPDSRRGSVDSTAQSIAPSVLFSRPSSQSSQTSRATSVNTAGGPWMPHTLTSSKTMANMRAAFATQSPPITPPPLPTLRGQRSLACFNSSKPRIAGHVKFENGRSGTPAAGVSFARRS